MFSEVFSFVVSFLSSSPRRSGKNEQASTIISPRRSPVVVDERFEKPIATVDDGQIVAETKAPTTLPSSPVMDKLSEEPMDTDNRGDIGQVERKNQTFTPLIMIIMDEPSDDPMEAVTSTSEDNDDDRADRAEDREATNNIGAPGAGTRNGYDHWQMYNKKALAQHLVLKERNALEKMKAAKNDKDTRYKLPNKFWHKCATALEKKGCRKTGAQCRNQVYVICKFSKDQMKNHFDLFEEEADLLFGLWSREKQRTRRPKGAQLPAKRDMETWTPEEETEFASYLVRDRMEDLMKMSEGRNVFHFFSDCSQHFHGERSVDAYRNRARKMRTYDDDTLKDVHKLTDKEIDLFRKPWLGRKKI